MKVVTFGYKCGGPPRGAAVIDCRVIPNPWFPGITLAEARRILDGEPRVRKLVKQGLDYAKDHPDGVIACGCAYGKHRSVVVAEKLRAALEKTSCPS